MFWFAAVFSLAAAGQTPAEPCRVEGAVVNAITGQPVRKARLLLTPVKSGAPVTGATDAQGKYVLANVAPGAYRLQVSHDGYQVQAYGARKPGEDFKGDSLDLTPGSVKTMADLRMTPLGAILGHIRDENGDPVRQVEVAVLAYGHGPAGKALQIRGASQTDATGEYRIFDLPPGKYYLRAKPQSSQMPAMAQVGESYATKFYPDVTQPTDAAAIDLAAGQEQRGLDFVLHPTSTATIRGRVIKPAGGENCVAALEGFGDGADLYVNDTYVGFTSREVLLTAAPGGGSEPVNWGNLEEMMTGGRKVDKDGRFEFRNIPVGSHSLTASCSVGKQQYNTKAPIQLEAAGLDNLELRPVGPSEITGQVQVEGESKSNIAETRISLAGGGMVVGGNNAPDGTVGEKGSFAYHDLPPETYRIHVEPPQDLYVKSVTWSGRDVLEPGVDLSGGGMSVALQVVLSANGGTIEGSVENGEGTRVTLIPSDPKRARTLTKLMVAEEGGHFSFPALPPGRYKLFAWEDADVNAALYDPEFRKPFEGKGETVDVAEKQKATVQLKAIPSADQ